MAAFVLAVLLLVATNQSAFAFEGREHIWVSRTAMCIANSYINEQYIERKKTGEANELPVLANFLKDKPGDYGGLVAFGDYTDRASTLVDDSKDGVERISAIPTEVPGVTKEWNRIERTRAALTSLLPEVLHNGHHFGLKALREYHKEHEHAVLLAGLGEPERLYDALAYNAFALHFLQDSFAPGHMTEETFGKSHMASSRVHDMHNDQGRGFIVNRESRREFDRILAKIDSLPDDSASSDQNLGVVGCSGKSFDSSDIQNFRNAIASGSIHLRGDDDLYRPDGCVVEGQKDQALLVILASSASIIEVVENYIDAASAGEAEDFRSIDLEPLVTDESRQCSEAKKVEETRCYFVDLSASDNFAANAFGKYTRSPGANTTSAVSACRKAAPAIATMQASESNKEAAEPSESDDKAAEPPAITLAEIAKWPILGTSVDLQRINGSARVQSSIELIWPLPIETGTFNLGLGYSYLARTGDLYNGHGPDIRLHWHYKPLGLLASADLGYRRWNGYGKTEDGFRVGGRIGFGNGLFFGFLSFARDKSPTSSGIKSDASIGAGVTMMLSTTRVPGIPSLVHGISRVFCPSDPSNPTNCSDPEIQNDPVQED